MTHMGYTTIQYIYSSSEWIADKLSLGSSLSVLHPIHSSAYVLMSVNRLSCAAVFGTQNTLWRWRCSMLAPGPGPRAYAAVAVIRSTCEEPRVAKNKSPAEVLCKKRNAFPDKSVGSAAAGLLQKCLFFLFSFTVQAVKRCYDTSY